MMIIFTAAAISHTVKTIVTATVTIHITNTTAASIHFIFVRGGGK